MLDSTNSMNRVQTYHTQQTIPKLLEEGFGIDLLELEYLARSSPIRQLKPSTCPTCQLPYVYEHITWCRGQTDGYTCKHHLPPCNLNQSGNPLKNRTVSSAAATNISRPNVFSTNAVFATIWPQDIESWIAQNSQEEDQC